MRGAPGQSTTQTLTLTNGTGADLGFSLIAQDVVVRGGARTFEPAGRTPGSIAATAVFSDPTITVRAGERRSVSVTVTLPPGAEHRAIVALFKDLTLVRSGGVTATVSLGTLMTFTASDYVSVKASDLVVVSQSPTNNATFEQVLLNDGAEPVVPTGIAVVLNAHGKMVGRTRSNPSGCCQASD